MSHDGPPLYRCVNCGCPMLDHVFEYNKWCECKSCECQQYLTYITHYDVDTWQLNLSANLIAAGLAALAVDEHARHAYLEREFNHSAYKWAAGLARYRLGQHAGIIGCDK